MNRRSNYLLLLCAVLGLCGCERPQDPLDQIVYATIDGTPLTARFVRDSVLISFRIGEINGRAPKPNEFDRAANGFAAKIIPRLISARMMEKYMAEEGVEATDEAIAQVLSNYNRQLKGDYRDLQSMAAVFGEQREAFICQFNREARLRTLEKRQKLDVVTEEDVTNYYRATSNQVKRAEMINRKAHEVAEKAYARLQAGESWERVAPEVSEDKLLDEDAAEYWKEWEEIPESGYIYPEVSTALAGISVGGYTKPFESEMGLLIVRVNSQEDGVRKCSRILFRMAKPVGFVPVEKLTDHLRRQKVLAGHRRILDEVGERTKFEYPQGEDFRVTIWPIDQKK